MIHLRVELDAVEAPFLVSDGHVGAGVRAGGQGEACGHLGHVVPVAHPGDPLLGQAAEQLAACIIVGDGFPVLPGGVVLGRGDLAAQIVGDELAAVADAQDRQALQIDGLGAAGEDDADGFHRLQLSEGRGVGLDLAVHIALPDPAGDELVVLSAEVDDKDLFHNIPPSVFDQIETDLKNSRRGVWGLFYTPLPP